MDVTLLLCDAAEESGGKLFVLGGGWNMLSANTPVNMALAVLMGVPWDRANHQLTMEAKLMTEDGEHVDIEGQNVGASGQLEVGRPPGMKPGTTLNVPFALKFNNVLLEPGGYRWELNIDGALMATAPFRAIVR